MPQFSALQQQLAKKKGVMINCKHDRVKNITNQLILELVTTLHGSLAAAPAVIKSNVNSVSITRQQF